jgi:hypothetical protein
VPFTIQNQTTLPFTNVGPFIVFLKIIINWVGYFLFSGPHKVSISSSFLNKNSRLSSYQFHLQSNTEGYQFT